MSRGPVFRHLIAILAWSVAATSLAGDDLPQVQIPKHRLDASELAVIVNDQDPLSIAIADYYRKRRAIPDRNIIHISFPAQRSQLDPDQFEALRRMVVASTPAAVQAYALTWALPYRVGCMSITSAFTFGFDKRWCSHTRCAPTAISPYFNSRSATPFTDLELRPTIALAANDIERARALIDRGIASDGSRPGGTAYLVSTTDKARNVRAGIFPTIDKVFSPFLATRTETTDALKDRQDVLFYFTGRKEVEQLDTLRFLPGAIADHLTSTGGQLDGTRQMSALRWLDAGATGSYGTVVEPCNLLGKFPNPGIVMQHYLQGETLIEAYWKSVQMPGEGIFIGEPLAAPFDFLELSRADDRVTLHTWSLAPGSYRLEAAPAPIGPFRVIGGLIRIGFPAPALRLPVNAGEVFRLMPFTPTTTHRHNDIDASRAQ